VHAFLVDALSTEDLVVSFAVVEVLWKAFSRLIWKLGFRLASRSSLHLFLTYGTPHSVGVSLFISSN